MDEIELTKKTERAARATELLDNELLKEAFKTLHDDYLSTWKITRLNDVNGRERLWQAIQLLGKVQDHLKKVIIDGRVASRDLAQIKTLYKR